MSTPAMSTAAAEDAQVTFRLTGRFDAHEAPEFQASFDKALLEGATTIAVNLSEVIFIDSTALAELVRAKREAESKQCTMVLEAPSDPVRVILELTRLATFFTLSKTTP
jgi:anti-anti-sigma factor